jgi:hypothetical protein
MDGSDSKVGFMVMDSIIKPAIIRQRVQERVD